MALISQPTQGAVVDASGNALPGYKAFFTAVFNLLIALTLSGTTTNRPTSFLFVGRPYFDQTLGYEIHYNGTLWVRWDGVPV